MAKQQDFENFESPTPQVDNIPIVTIPRTFSKSYGNIFLIAAILLAEAIAAYTIIALNYTAIYEMVYSERPNFGGFYEINDLVINPANSNGQRFLVTSIGIQLRTTNDIELLQKREIIIKDAIITILSRRTAEELGRVELRMELKQEIGIVVNQILNKEVVRNLFFTKYVMQ